MPGLESCGEGRQDCTEGLPDVGRPRGRDVPVTEQQHWESVYGKKAAHEVQVGSLKGEGHTVRVERFEMANPDGEFEVYSESRFKRRPSPTE